MNSPQQTSYSNDDEISLVDLAVLLVKRWKLMLVIFLLVMLAAIVYVLLRAPTYTYTSLYVMAETVDETGDFIGLESPNAVLTRLDLTTLPNQIRTYLDVNSLAGLPFEINLNHPEDTNLISLTSRVGESQAEEVNALHQQVLNTLAKEQAILLERKRTGLEERLAGVNEAISDAGMNSGVLAMLAEQSNKIKSELDALRAGEIRQVAVRGLQREGVGSLIILALAAVIGIMLSVMGGFFSHFITVVHRSLKEK